MICVCLEHKCLWAVEKYSVLAVVVVVILILQEAVAVQ